jgi:putative endonuclease
VKYAYLLESEAYPVTSTQASRTTFVTVWHGMTVDSSRTAKFRQWRLKTYIGFTDEQKALAFERYLMTASGRAFAKKRL